MEDKSEKVLIWGVFYSLAASGKAEFIERLTAESKLAGINCKMVSNDEAQAKVIDKIQKEDPSISNQEARNMSKGESVQMFNSMVKKAIKNMKPGRNIIIIEKTTNHANYLSSLNKLYRPNCRTMLVAFMPKEEGFFTYHTSKYVVPFSQGQLANSLYRTINRGEHLTMIGSNLKKVFIALSFVKLYDGLQRIKEKEKEQVVDVFHEINFTVPFKPEMDQLVPKEFTMLLKKALRDLTPFSGDMDVCSALTEYLCREEFIKDFSDIIGLAPKEVQIPQIKEFFKLFDHV